VKRRVCACGMPDLSPRTQNLLKLVEEEPAIMRDFFAKLVYVLANSQDYQIE
jgi:hypothetical protein